MFGDKVPSQLPSWGGDVWARLVPGSIRPWVLAGIDLVGTSASCSGTVPVGQADVEVQLDVLAVVFLELRRCRQDAERVERGVEVERIDGFVVRGGRQAVVGRISGRQRDGSAGAGR